MIYYIKKKRCELQIFHQKPGGLKTQRGDLKY